MSSSKMHEQMSVLARDLEGQDSAGATLQYVVDSARDLIPGCGHAGISLAARRGKIKTSAATDDVPVRSDEMQIELDEGPCRDAVWEHRLVSAPDLQQESRWPRWAPRAASELGVRSMLCLRLFTHGDRVGALNLFSTTRHGFGVEDVELGLAVAAQAAIAIAAAEKIEQLETGLVSRTAVGQATGLVMARYEVSSSVAFSLLTRLSSHSNRKLAVIAAELVASHDEQPQSTRTRQVLGTAETKRSR